MCVDLISAHIYERPESSRHTHAVNCVFHTLYIMAWCVFVYMMWFYLRILCQTRSLPRLSSRFQTEDDDGRSLRRLVFITTPVLYPSYLAWYLHDAITKKCTWCRFISFLFQCRLKTTCTALHHIPPQMTNQSMRTRSAFDWREETPPYDSPHHHHHPPHEWWVLGFTQDLSRFNTH